MWLTSGSFFYQKPYILSKYPLLRARRRPEGAAEGGAGGIVSKYFENIPLFSKYFENMPIHVFSKWPNSGFPSFRVWPGTQDPTPWAQGPAISCPPPKQKVLLQQNMVTLAKQLTLDLATGGPESTWDTFNPLPQSLLCKRDQRSAHHLPPDPNILK